MISQDNEYKNLNGSNKSTQNFTLGNNINTYISTRDSMEGLEGSDKISTASLDQYLKNKDHS